MKIVIREEGKLSFVFWFPSGVLLSPVTALLAPALLRKCGMKLTRRQAAAFIRALNRYRRRHRDWKLVEVQEADGSRVVIKI